MADGKRTDDYTIEMDKLDQGNKGFEAPPPPQPRSAPSNSLQNNPVLPVLAYCGSSILMTVMNKYVLSGTDFNLNFFLLCIQVRRCSIEHQKLKFARSACTKMLTAVVFICPQSVVCIVAIQTCKACGIITYRDFSADEARKCMQFQRQPYPLKQMLTESRSYLGFPITLLLIGMIYTGSKALQFLSIPVYTIFKNLTIILIAYGEVLWFGGSVTGLTLFSFGLMVLSSLIAAWADIKHAVESSSDATTTVSTLNAGYIWMLINCLCTSSYVLGMRKRIKLTNFKDFDSQSFPLRS